jgi:hypothetical protein
MRWGDKLDVILAVSESAADNGGVIDWDDAALREEAAEGRKAPWSTKDRKAVFKELVDAVGGMKQDITSTIDAICTFLQDEHVDDLEDHYDPIADGPPDDEEVEEASTQKVKRKRSNVSATTNKKFKSNDMITASDDEL